MLPSLYQACAQAHLNSIQQLLLEMMLAIAQRERHVTIERLATLLAQPIQFESRRRCVQRFLSLPQLSPQKLWFPVMGRWVKQKFKPGNQLKLAIDRTQWSGKNLFVVVLLWQKRAIPIYWCVLDKQGSSNLKEQQTLLRPVLRLFQKYRVVVLADREFHSVKLAHWLRLQRATFVLRLKGGTTIEDDQAQVKPLSDVELPAGLALFIRQVRVTRQEGFGKFNVAMRCKRKYRAKENQVWYLLTNLDSLETALALYRTRFQIEGMFKDYKSGGYHLSCSHAKGQRLVALVLLIAMAYTDAAFRGQRIKQKGVQYYIGRVQQTQSQSVRHSSFWVGLYGSLWLGSMELWQNLAYHLMQLKPHKLPYYQKGLRAMQLIQTAF